MAENLDILKLQPGDNPVISLVTTLLDGSNFLSWSRSIKLALIVKTKLSFISKDAEILEKDTKEFKQWIKADSMVTSWVLNSISRVIVESFMYTSTSRQLWTELESRYGQSNNPMAYRLKRKLASLQGCLDLSTYFSKLKRLWDELACTTPVPKCTCTPGCSYTAAKESAEIKSSDQLMQFLMGLNDTYGHVRSQILMMEPYPNVRKAFSMVLRVEKQNEEDTKPQHASQNVAMQVYKKPDFLRNFQKKRNFVDKKSQVCKECGKSGHLKEVCFEIHGYPDWYKNLVEQRKKNANETNRVAAVMEKREDTNKMIDEREIAEVLKTELHKILGGLKPQTLAHTDANYIDFS
ncbi:UNVERIFIED_CONTAM: hypothetical protein Sindi_0728600, partial [Sesamum indicum]